MEANPIAFFLRQIEVFQELVKGHPNGGFMTL